MSAAALRAHCVLSEHGEGIEFSSLQLTVHISCLPILQGLKEKKISFFEFPFYMNKCTKQQKATR